MDFQLTPAQEDVRDGMRKLCAGRFPIAALRELDGFDAGWWQALDDAGVFSLRATGFGVAEAALVFEELGRGLVPGPLIWSHLAASLGITGVVGGVVRGDGPVVVEHLGDLDALLVLDTAGVWDVPVSSVTGAAVPPLDPFTPVWRVPALPAGSQVAGPDVAAQWGLEGATLAAASLAGMAGALVDLTVAYTKERKQFGRPVGSFQALKHTMADMLVRAEMARVQAYAAAVMLSEGAPGAGRAVASAKVVAGEAARRNAADSLQCHGGMGYTWEIDSHLYLKRAWVYDALFGSADSFSEDLVKVL